MIKNIRYLIGIIASIVVIVLGVTIYLHFNNKGGKVTTVSKSSLEKILEISELSTIEYTYNAVCRVYDENNEKILYNVAYEGTVKAGIDFSNIQIDVDNETKHVSVTLPPITITECTVDQSSLDYIFTKDKYETETIVAEAYSKSLEDLNNRAKSEDKLMEMARDNAIDTIEALIKPWVEQIDKEYTVEVK